MSTLSPITPIQANHRFIQKCIRISCDGAEERQEEIEHINDIFLRFGGSWEKIFKGDPEHIYSLKKIIKIAFKNGRISKKPDWGVK